MLNAKLERFFFRVQSEKNTYLHFTEDIPYSQFNCGAVMSLFKDERNMVRYVWTKFYSSMCRVLSCESQLKVSGIM